MKVEIGISWWQKWLLQINQSSASTRAAETRTSPCSLFRGDFYMPAANQHWAGSKSRLKSTPGQNAQWNNVIYNNCPPWCWENLGCPVLLPHPAFQYGASITARWHRSRSRIAAKGHNNTCRCLICGESCYGHMRWQMFPHDVCLGPLPAGNADSLWVKHIWYIRASTGHWFEDVDLWVVLTVDGILSFPSGAVGTWGSWCLALSSTN